MNDENGRDRELLEEISALKKRIAELEGLQRETESLQHALLDSLPAGVVIIDPATRVIEDVNRTAALMFGEKPEHIIGNRCHSFLCPTDENSCPVCDLGNDIDYSERQMICSDGSMRPILKSAKRVVIKGRGKLLECFADLSEQKHAQEALRETEQMFKDLSEKSLAGIYLIQDGMFRYVNAQFAGMLGYPAYEMTDRVSAKDVIFPEDWPVAQENIRKRLSGEIESLNYSSRIVTRDNEVREVEIFSSRTTYHGRPAIIGTCIDITDRRRIEAAARKYARDLAERVKELNCLYTLSQVVRRDDISLAAVLQECASTIAQAYLYPEIAACRIIWGDEEYSTGNFRRTAWIQTEPVTIHGAHAGSIEVCYLEERPQEFEGPFLAEERRLLRSVADLIGRSTERKATERALKESEIKHRAIFEHANDTIFLIHEGRFVDCNPKALAMFRCRREEIIGQSPHAFSPPRQPGGRDSEEMAAEKMNAALRGEAQRFEWAHRRYDGAPFDAEIGLNPIELDGRLYIQAIVRDISDRKRIEAEREKLIHELTDALSQVKVLSGLLPVCASCKKIRNDKGNWEQMEVYIRDRSDATFTHGYCPECMEKLRSELNFKKK